LSPAQIEAWRVEMNLPQELSDEELLMQESMRDLRPTKRKRK
jgi:hypothetical protein